MTIEVEACAGKFGDRAEGVIQTRVIRPYLSMSQGNGIDVTCGGMKLFT